MSHAVRISAMALADAVRNLLVSEGVPDAIARVEAEVMVEADRCGVPSHGVLMLPRLIAGLRDGRATKVPDIRVVRESGATSVLDGDRGPGRFLSVTAMDLAVARARTHGVGVCLAINTTHWGRAHAYAARAARAGMLGLCTTNAIPTMRLPGVPKAVLGNNPIAMAVPRGEGRDPVVLDLAMSQAALGKVATHRREGRSIPAGWGADRTGAPTEDPAEVLASGLLEPMGGYKGLGLALMLELFTAGLAGGALGHEISAADATGLDPGASKLFVALAPSAFGDPAGFERRVEAMLDHLHGADPEHTVLAPGERGWLARDESDRAGIRLHGDVVTQLAAVGIRLTEQGPAR